MSGIKYFLGGDGKLHGEQRIGSMRFDPLNPGVPMTTIVGQSSNVTSTLGADGKFGMELRNGQQRWKPGQNGFDTFIN